MYMQRYKMKHIFLIILFSFGLTACNNNEDVKTKENETKQDQQTQKFKSEIVGKPFVLDLTGVVMEVIFTKDGKVTDHEGVQYGETIYKVNGNKIRIVDRKSTDIEIKFKKINDKYYEGAFTKINFNDGESVLEAENMNKATNIVTLILDE
ncbi:hypothetical protein [Macrococcus armenti]|uniref:hypothetical protein n=1 Tax=Macrococcus armenti TaxID=2875764 RepID=UPI001CD5E73C|nr:hypothetical protein [Macrococcus armenti]UBH11643.1 hypothetical protein LAU38_04020 [Macrococcus armenti]